MCERNFFLCDKEMKLCDKNHHPQKRAINKEIH